MYNSMSQLPFIPYRILTYLANNDDIIWKLLKYNTYDALSKPNLTFDDKMNLIWTKDGPQEPFNIFMTNIIDDAIPTSKCVMKIYNYYIHAKELYTGIVVYAFDLLYGPKMSNVQYQGVPVLRWDLFVNRILYILNGQDVGGVGKLTFLDDLSRYSAAKSVIGNSKTFTGGQIFLGVNIGDAGEVSECGN